MSAKQVLIGTISGIVAGAVVGLLLAPSSGEETRGKLAEGAEELKRRLKKAANRTKEEYDDLKASFESEIDGVSDDVRNKVLGIIDKSKSKYYDAKSKVETSASSF